MRTAVQQLRQEPTPAEEQLWLLLRNRQLREYKFRRQYAIDRFIVDFYCSQAHLIIEVDGPIHQFQIAEDQERQHILEVMGFHILRFTNDQVLQTPDDVLAEIARYLDHPSSAGSA